MNARNGVSVGLTGGIACGKSTVEAILREAGWPVLDTDKVGHAVLEPDSPVFPEVVAAFGDRILDGDGRIDRRTLGTLVFADDGKRKRLNALVHPEIGRRWREWLQEQIEAGPVAVVSIPLLYEVGAENEFDHTCCVWAPEGRMIEHLKARGLSDDEIRQRIESQWPVETKAARADSVIRNDGSLEELRERVNTWMAEIRHRK